MPYVERITKTGKTVKVDRYYTSRGCKKAENARKAAAKMRQILNADGKDQ